MPGGWCEKCGKCDEFFGPHIGCLDVCKWFERERSLPEKEQPQ